MFNFVLEPNFALLVFVSKVSRFSYRATQLVAEHLLNN
jgi:hypothetical protein